MKKKLYFRVFLLIIIVGCLLIVKPNKVYGGNIKYFGYFWTSNLYSADNFVAIKDYTNANFISNVWTTSDVAVLAQKDIDYLNKLSALGMKGIIDLSVIFWDISTTPYTLRNDWGTRFNDYWKLIYPHLSKIAAFYPVDEPDSNVNWSDYDTVVHVIKMDTDSVSYDLPILMILTPIGVLRVRSGELVVSPGVEWLGFDEYDCWGTECFQGVSIEGKLNIMINEAKKVAGRKVVVIPEGFYADPKKSDEETVLSARARDYYNLCISKPECVGIFPFLWDNLNSSLRGVSTMPVLESTFKTIGQSIIPPTCAEKCTTAAIGTCNSFTNSCSNTMCGGSPTDPNYCIQRASQKTYQPNEVRDCGSNVCTCYTCVNLSTTCTYGCNLSSCSCNSLPLPTPTMTITHTPTKNPTPTPSIVPCQTCSSGPAKSLGNANCDGKINALDFGIWKNVFLNPVSKETEKAAMDFDCLSGDNIHTINLLDFKIWAGNFR